MRISARQKRRFYRPLSGVSQGCEFAVTCWTSPQLPGGRARAKAVIRSPRSDRLMTLRGEAPKTRPAVLLRDARHGHLAAPIVNTAIAVPLSPVNARIVSMRRGGSRCRSPAWVPITTVGDRAGMLRIGRGALPADYERSMVAAAARFEARRSSDYGLMARLPRIGPVWEHVGATSSFTAASWFARPRLLGCASSAGPPPRSRSPAWRRLLPGRAGRAGRAR